MGILDAPGIPRAVATTKGDLFIATAAGIVTRHAVPATNGQTLVADSSQADGWAADYPLSRREAAFRPTGAIAETVTRGYGVFTNTLTALASGQLGVVALALPANRLITSITFMSGTTALGVGSNQWFALIDSSLGVLRKTVDDTSTAWGASATKTLNLSSTFTTTYAGLYYLGVCVVATTMPTFIGQSDVAAPNQVAPILSGNSNSGLTDPASLGGTASAITGTGRKMWAWVS